MTQTQSFDTVGFMQAFESGEADYEAVVEGIQHLIDTGAAWKLGGLYARKAQELLASGACSEAADR